MSFYNPFASYTIAVPKKYSDEIKKFCKQSETKVQGEFTPFNRQVDFWYFAFIYAVQMKLSPDYIPNSEMSNITAASILDNYHINHIQMVYLANYLDIEKLDDSRDIFNYTAALANSGMPHVLQILNDIEEGKPLFNILDYIENLIKE